MIKLINVSKKYRDKLLFENVNLEINNAGIYSFIGENGCGKTTLLNIISKFIKPSRGKVISKDKVSFISQTVNLIQHLNIKDHFSMLKVDINHLKKVRLHNKINAYPYELSYGQRQRVACVLSLYSSASIIVCDEPTSHLDSKSEEIMMKEILKVSKKKIVLLVSHNDDLINKYSTKIFKIENRKMFVIKDDVSNKKVNKEKIKKMKLRKYYKRSIGFYKKNSFLFWLICFINFFMLLSSFNFYKCINDIVDSSITSSLDYNKFYLKKCEEVEKEITFKVCDNLKDSDINKIENSEHKVGYNYDLLMNSLYKSDKFNVINTNDYALSEGRYPTSYNEIITNDEYKIGDIITIETSQVISMDKTDIYNKSLELIVVGTIKKSILLNKDNYYLDYNLLENYLKNEYLINNKKTLFDYFEYNKFNDYKYILYFKEIDIDFLKNNNIDYLSASYEYYDNIKSLSKEISEYILYLNIIVVLFSIYYLYKIIKKKTLLKEDEIKFFKAMGVNSKKTIKTINKENKKIIFNSFSIVLIIQLMLFYMIFDEIYMDIVSSMLSLFFLLFISNKITSKAVKRRLRI